MAGSVNKVILIGNLGKDPELRSMQSGDKVATLSLATSENWKDKTTGERKERTEWHRVVIFNQAIVKIVETYLRKGAKIWIEGQLETRKWMDKQGLEKYSTEVILRPFRGSMTMLSGAKGDRDNPPPYADDEEYGQEAAKASPANTALTENYDEDEIPF